ncbi:MAG: NADPH-dependent FMN reductase [Lautropia sp.]|nr:NADPH-dependent FMN reductase [Lautropia sp.]
MTSFLAISGSLRAGSFNTALANAAAELVPEGVQVEVATLHGIPLYDGDIEASEGIPNGVLRLKEKVMAHDGLLLVTPEYNRGVPAALKNAIDWLSRADSKAVFGGRPVALMGASPGGFGTQVGQIAWLPTLKHLGTRIYSGADMLVSRVQDQVDGQGRLTDERTRQALADFLAGFAAFVAQQKG